MFPLAHLGFTAAPGAMIATWWGENRGFASRAPDLRWLLAGAVLPDFTDKLVGQVLFKSYFENGRIFAHTFALTILVLTAGVYEWRRRGDSRILLLALGMAGHLVLDRIWVEPNTALWPALGPFERHPTTQTFLEQIIQYARDPAFWVTESVGAALLVASLRRLGVRSVGDVRAFLLRGASPALVEFEPGSTRELSG